MAQRLLPYKGALYLWVPSCSPLWLCGCHKHIRLTGSSKLGIGNLWPCLHPGTAGRDSSSPPGVKVMLEKNRWMEVDVGKLLVGGTSQHHLLVPPSWLITALKQCAMFCKHTMTLHLRFFFFFQWCCGSKAHASAGTLNLPIDLKKKMKLWETCEIVRSLIKMLIFNKSTRSTNSVFIFIFLCLKEENNFFQSPWRWNKSVNASVQCSQVQLAGPGECLLAQR